MQSSELKNLDIAILGAGYAGAAAGKALSLLGCNVTLYEQASAIHEVGAGIGLRPATMDCFARWGMVDVITNITSPSDCLKILTSTCDPILEEPWPERDVYGYTTHFIHRGDFIDALLSVLPPDMVRLGHRVETVTDHGDRATVGFANGTETTADLVIGADGIKSVVRKQLFSDEEPVFSGERAYRTVIPLGATAGMVPDANFRMFLGHGTKVYLLPLPHRDQVSFDITALSPDDTWTPVVTKADVLATVQGFDERIVTMAGSLDLSLLSVRGVYDIEPIDTWHSDSVGLVGDAAHAMLHHQGMGANSAIMDVSVLADALRDANSVKEALAHYQTARKPVTDELQRISRQGWSDGEITDAFPGQKPATFGAQG